jgi:hypothetical protein
VAVGEMVTFTATAYDIYNNAIPGVNFIWTTNVGSIDATGLFTAQTIPGTGIVTATNGTVSGSATVNVIPGAIDHIILTPNTVTVTVGGTQQFSVTAYDIYYNAIPGVNFIWTTNVGSVNATGFFTAQTIPGTGTVTATNGTINVSATVTIIPGPVNHITVTPNPATVTVGDSQLFNATAYDSYNNVITNATFTWTTTVGSVNAIGLFTAQTTPATGIVTATSGTVNGSATVNIILGAIDHITVTPDPVTMTVGGTQQFSATAYDLYNNVIPGVNFIWTTNVGSVNTTGYFTAQATPGTGVVTATNGTVSHSAIVDVISGPVHHITVFPDPCAVPDHSDWFLHCPSNSGRGICKRYNRLGNRKRLGNCRRRHRTD